MDRGRDIPEPGPTPWRPPCHLVDTTAFRTPLRRVGPRRRRPAHPLRALGHGASRDADRDGMPNRWEVAHHLDPHRANAQGDPDHDGLRNLAEYRHHTDPRDEDTDNDGDDDGDEVHDGALAPT